jgi:programmed cell death 6-interacting protein
LLKKAEEVRLEEGPSRIEGSIENVEKLAEYNTKLLDEV